MSFFNSPGQFGTESGNYDPGDPFGGAGPQTNNGMTPQGAPGGAYTFVGPNGQTYYVSADRGGNTPNYLQSQWGVSPSQTATSPTGDIGIPMDVANSIGAATSQPDFFSSLGPGILALPFLAAAGGQMAFGGGFGGGAAAGAGGASATGGAGVGAGAGTGAAGGGAFGSNIMSPLAGQAGSWAGGAAGGDALAGMGVGGAGDLGATMAGGASTMSGSPFGFTPPGSSNWLSQLLGGSDGGSSGGSGGGYGGLSGLLGPALGAGIQAYGANQAANTMAGGANQAAGLYAPYLQAAGQALPYMSSMAGIPGSAPLPANWMAQDPSYQFRLNQGMNAIQNQGSLSPSGNTLKALEDYAQGSASQEYGNIFNRVGTIAGYGLPAAGGAGNALTGAANASAAGTAGVTNAVTGGISNIANNWLMSQLIQRLGSQGA